MKNLKTFTDRFAHGLEFVLAALFMILFLVTMLNIVLRNIGGVTWLWIPGFMRLVFIWLVFLGITVAYRRGDHLIVDLFMKSLGPKGRSRLTLAIESAQLPFFALLLAFGIEVARVRMRISFETWQVPTGYAYLAVPVSAAILLAFALERLVTTWLELRKS